MLSLDFNDAAGIEQHYIRQIYDLSWSYIEKGGPLSLIAAVPIDLIAPKIGLIDSVSLYDGLDEIWLGRVRERPTVTADKQAGIITAEGYIKHLEDDSMQTLYIDSGLGLWDDRTLFAEKNSNYVSSVNPSRFINDKFNRLWIGIKRGQVYDISDQFGWMYEAPGGYIKRFTSNWSTSYDNGFFELAIYAWNGSWTQIWHRNVYGTFSGTLDISTSTTPSGDIVAAIPANSTALIAVFICKTAVTLSGQLDNEWYGRLTNPKVYYELPTDWKTSTVIKDILGKKAPLLSTDYSQIADGTYTLADFFDAKKKNPHALIKELNKYEVYNYGVWDRDSSGKPRFHFKAHELGTVHYFTSLRDAKPDLAGDSIENQFNSVDVEYQSQTGRTLTTTRTKALDLLTKWGITRSPSRPLSIQTTSQTSANQAGDIELNDRARPQGKGSLTIKGFVRDNYGRKIAAHQIRPGKNILIRDLRASPQTLADMTSSDVLNGINIFRIVQVDAKPFEATLQLDNEGDRLDLYLAKAKLT